jgi:ubiquinone/menaquinone biosynthesis C-methylase UbiE
MSAIMAAEFKPDHYFDSCAVCGTFQVFERTAYAIRETYRCKTCKALLREREQAQAIVNTFGRGAARSIAELIQCSDFSVNRIYEPGTVGPFRSYFKQLPYYHQSDFYENSEDAAKNPLLPHQNLEALSYADETFDLVISSDILEHVRRPAVAFSESARVLRVGGYNIFTVPLQDPIPRKTIVRVSVEGDRDIPILPEHYHGNGKGGRSLVYTDFGADIVEMLSEAGFSASFQRPQSQSSIVNQVVTVVAQRVR